MKIGIDGRPAYFYRGTGIGTYTYQLINSLNKVDSKNNYVIFTPEKESSNMNLSKNIKENTINNFWDEVNIPNILKDSNIDIYHVPQNGVGLPEEKTCPFTITLHDVIPYRMPETVSDRYMKIFSEKIPKIVSMTDGIITVSEFSKKDIVKSFGYPEDKIYVSYLSNEDIYKPLKKDICKNIIKKKYKIEKDFIFYVGGFSLRKNIPGLIKAFSKLITLYDKEISLVIGGKTGPLCEEYKKLAEKLNIKDKVIFPGFIPLNDMPYFYNGANLFVYPSFYEGFGLPPVEAMACGTPVIASNTTCIPEIVQDGAKLVNPYDINDLCDSILQVLLDKKFSEKLRIFGLKRASNLSWRRCARETLSAYEKIINC